MMDFAAAWATLQIGDRCTVSDGAPEPRDPNTVAWRAWRSHNFDGTVSGKGLETLVFDVEGPLSTVRYVLTATVARTFTVPDEDVDGAPHLLAAAEAGLLAAIDSEAGAFRLRFITDVPGQPQTYDAKAREAAAYVADPNGTYPFLAAEAQASGLTVATVAATINATAAQWTLLAAGIEGARMGAKRAVRDASTWAAKKAAAVVDWEGLLP